MNQAAHILRSAAAALLLLTAGTGCDTAYHYLFFPPEQPEYMLVPDFDMVLAQNDSSYSIGKDSLSISFNRQTYKVEVKFMSDYQLNTFEYPEDSKDREFSANPFTYANWVDPQLGYTPSRFSVFKISIFNYAASKLNYDPEKSFLVTDRGDKFPGYGREEKSSKNMSLEAYFKRRKGASGVEDDIFERRMGTIRTAVLSLSRPIYSGDSRDGFVVFDPLDETVEQSKLVLKDFIIGYDENNEPSDFIDLTFYFKRTLLNKNLIKPRLAVTDSALIAVAASGERKEEFLPRKNFELHQVKYRQMGEEESGGGGTEEWNSRPGALPALAELLKDSLKAAPVLKQSPADSPDLINASVAFLLVGPSEPAFTDAEIATFANMIRQGGFLFIDNSAFTSKYQYYNSMAAVLQNVGSKLDRSASIATIPNDHDFFRAWHRLNGPPEGMDDVENLPDKRNYLQGLFWRNRLVGLLSSKGYSMMWEEGPSARIDQMMVGANAVLYGLRTARKQN